MLEMAPAWPRRCAPIATFSSTLMSGTSLTCWKVLAMPSFATSCGGALSMFLPCTEMVPPEEVSTPVIRLKVVLLPAPLGPIRATISRAWTSKETSLTAITPPNCFRALSILSSAPGAAAGRSRAGRVREVSGRLRNGLNGSRPISQGQTPVGASCSSSTSRMPNTMVSSWPSPRNSSGR